MDLTGRPLLDTDPDHLLFAGREEELDRLVRLARAGTNTVVIGERGSGKTTLLRQAAYRLRQVGEAPVFVEGRLADTPRRFLDLVRARLGLPPLPERAEDPIELAAAVAALRDGTTQRRVVLVDEVAPAVAATVFGRLRDEVWQLPLTWVVAATPDDSVTLRTPPADAFFAATLALDDLGRDEQRRVLEARLGEEGARLARQIDEGNPRRLIALARAVRDEGSTVESWQERERDRARKLAELGRPATMLMAELESLGAASASDERLLERLGWTRSRAVQVFRELEEAGLVTSSYAKGPGGGRQKVYRPLEGGR